MIFDEPTRRKIEGLRWRLARLRSRGGGGSRSERRRGGRQDFRDHRAYAPGDDLRQLDWHVLGRLGEYHLKQFDDQSEVEILIWLDRSASMGLADKDKTARRLAAGLAFGWLGERRLVRIEALGAGAPNRVVEIRRETEAPRIFETLEALPEAEGPMDWSLLTALEKPGRHPRRVYLISDLLDPDDPFAAIRNGLPGMVDFAAFTVVSPKERRPDAGGMTRLLDCEGEGGFELALSEPVLAAYRRRFEAQLEARMNRLAALGAGFTLAETREPFDETLLRFFGAAEPRP